MIGASTAFREGIRGSHKIVTRIRVISTSNYIGVSPPGRDLKIVEGSVTLDGTADIRGHFDAEVAEKWPYTNTTDDLVPYGTEVQVSRGIEYGNGGIERIPLGIYRLDSVEQDDAPFGTIRLVGQDRMAQVKDSELEIPRVFMAGTSVGSVVQTLVQEVYPNQVPQWDSADSTTGSSKLLGITLVAEQDRFGFLDDLIKALGKIWYFDYRGQLVIKSPPTSKEPVYTINAGADGVLVSAHRNLSREGIYNAVIVTGEALNTVTPIRQVVYDLDPNSATRYGGPFGKIPTFYSSPAISDAVAAVGNLQAVLAGTAVLEKIKGLPYNIDFQSVPAPFLEPYDPVTVVYAIDLEATPKQRTEQHVLDKLTIGLGAEQAMGAATRLTSNKGAQA